MKITTQKSGLGQSLRALMLLLAIGRLCDPQASLSVGFWTPLAHSAPGSVQLMLLLSDGSVIAANNPTGFFGCCQGNNWFRLTPDSQGSYINGTWTTLASMHDTRLFYASDILPDGRLFVAGGEYGSGSAAAEIYDPQANTWTQISPPATLLDPTKSQSFIDSESIVIANGNVLISPVAPNTYGGTLIYNPSANTWSAGPSTFSGYQDEASWVKLPDGSILTVDPFGNNTERYLPALNLWVQDAPVTNSLGNPIMLYDSINSEIGPALLLPDGRAFFIGGSGLTAFYRPSGNNNPGTWTQGPNIPNGLSAQDAPAAMMSNGKILCAFGSPGLSKNSYPSTTWFFEFDPVANTFTPVNGPTGATDSPAPYETVMLDLPDGNVLYAHIEQNNAFYSDFGSQLYVYTPDGSPLASGKPTINSVSLNFDGSYHLVGTQINGISAGSAYGDDEQMNSNYPLVRLTDGSGNVYYARTYNWSSTGVMTGSTPVSTEFSLPAFLPPGPYSLVVVANGISSDPISFSGPVYVDFNYAGIQFGTMAFPYETMALGVGAVPIAGEIILEGAGSSAETMTISKPMTISAIGFPSTIGH